MHTTAHSVLLVIVGILLLIDAGGLIATSVIQGLGAPVGLANEAEFGLQLTWWAFVGGIVLLIAVILMIIEYFVNRGNGKQKTAGFLSWAWGLLMFFLLVPWLIVGQILLLRVFMSVSTNATWLYAFSIAYLVLGYIMLAYAAWFTSNVNFFQAVETARNRTFIGALDTIMAKAKITDGTIVPNKYLQVHSSLQSVVGTDKFA